MMKYLAVSISALTTSLLCGIATQAQPLGPTLTQIKESGEIALGHRLSSAPFSYVNEQGQPEGYSIDLCLEIVEEIKEELELSTLKVQYVQMDTTTRIPLVRNGTIDLACGSATNTLSRQKEVDFTHITYVTGVRLLVKKNSKIQDIGSMAGQAIGVSAGTTSEKVIRETLKKDNIEAQVYNEIKDHDEGFAALEADLIQAYATDDVLLYGLRNKAQNPEAYEVVGELLSYEPYGLMLRRDDSAFRLVANRRLSELFRSGEIEEIFGKWFYPLGIALGANMEYAFRLQSLPE